MEIRFFLPGKRYGFLSNYFEYPFILGGLKWRTVEHYYQAQKLAGIRCEDKIRRAKTPDGAKGYAHTRKELWRHDWDDVKVEVMRAAVHAKFTQSGFLARELVLTGRATLIENSPTDWFWGIGADGTGKNILGVILMDTRETLCQ